MISNIWVHWKTSTAGLLIGAMAVAGTLAQQGVTLGHIGTGTGITLLSAIATTLLGLLARDPATPAEQPAANQAKLGAWALIGLVMLGTMPVLTGCTQQQKVSVAQEIVQWTPVFISTADTVNAAIEGLDPATVLVLGPLTAAINAFGPQFELAAQNYLANSNQTTLQVLQSLITQIQQNVNSTLLAAAKVTNPTSQATATKQINLLATIANTILALVESISTKAQIAAMAMRVNVTLAEVRPYMDAPALRLASIRVSRDLALSQAPTVDQFFAYEQSVGF